MSRITSLGHWIEWLLLKFFNTKWAWTLGETVSRSLASRSDEIAVGGCFGDRDRLGNAKPRDYWACVVGLDALVRRTCTISITVRHWHRRSL